MFPCRMLSMVTSSEWVCLRSSMIMSNGICGNIACTWCAYKTKITGMYSQWESWNTKSDVIILITFLTDIQSNLPSTDTLVTRKPVHFRDRSANGRLKMLHLYIAETIVVAVCLQEERLDCTTKLGSKTSRDNQWKSNIHAVLPISFTNSPESTWTLAFSTKYQPAVCHHWILWLGF